MNTLDDVTKRCFETLLAATAADNFEGFVSVGDEGFKRGLKPEAFHQVSRGLAPRLQQGFIPNFLGEFKQTGHVAYLWRLRFNDGSEDRLFRLAMAGGKVVGALVGPAMR